MLNPSLDMPLSGIELGDKKKKQKLVKHKRKNWKKTNISEVEKGIDDLRHQELTGGVRAEKKDEELFYINKTKLNLDEDSGDLIRSSKRQKLSIQEKLNSLHCYRNLRPDVNSAPAHIVRSLRPPTEDSKRQMKLQRLEMKKSKFRLAAKKMLNSRSNDKENLLLTTDKDVATFNKLNAKKEKDDRLKTTYETVLKSEFNKNLWTTSDLPEITDTNEYFLRSTKKLSVRKPKNPIYTPSALPKLELPHPGTSYNPDYDEHQELLLKAHIVELKNLQEEQKMMRKLARHAKKMSWAEMERIWIEEMSVKDLFEPETGENADEEEEEPQVSKEMSISKREMRRRLEKEKYGRTKANESKAKRLKKRLQERIKQREKENEKKIRIQQNEIYRLKSLKKEVDDKLKKEEDAAEQRIVDEKNRELYGQKRLGSLKYEEPELALKLSSEITGSLRTLKAEGNILRDRYKSLQKRNLIEPRDRAKAHHKFWKKKYEKRNALEKTNLVFENNNNKQKNKNKNKK